MIKFDYSHEFDETSVDVVRSKIVAWLNAERAQKIKEDGATSIMAVHGTLKTFKPYERNGKKKLRFDLSPKGRSVVVSASVSPSLATIDDIQNSQEETRLNWGFLLEELWASVEGVSATPGREELVAERKELQEKRKEASKKLPGFLVKYGLAEVAMLAVIAAFIVLVLGVELDTTLMALLVIPIIGSIVMVAWGLLKIWSQKRAGSYL